MHRLDDEEPGKSPEAKLKWIDSQIDEALLKARRVFLCDSVDMDSAKEIIRKLWYLELTDPGKPILFVINSPGGSVDAGFAIWDQVKLLSSPVTTLVTGLAASMGSVLSLCGKKRLATPNARFMIHQPRVMGVIQGQASDLLIHADEIQKSRQRIVGIYEEITGKDPKEIDRDIDRDRWLSAEEAQKYGKHGLITGIVSSPKDLKM